MRTGGRATFAERVGELELPECLRAQMAPLLEVMRSGNAQLKAADKALAEQAKTHEVANRLCTAAGVGPGVDDAAVEKDAESVANLNRCKV